VSNHPQGLAYQLFAWKQAIESAFCFRCYYFIASENGRVHGVFPLAHVHLPLCKGELISLPYCDAGGILADTKEVENLLLGEALKTAFRKGIKHVSVRAQTPLGQITPQGEHTQKVRMLLALPGNADKLLAGFRAKLRSQVRKPMRDGLKSVIGGKELIDDFYKIFVENMRDLGSPVHSKKWLWSVLNFYGPGARCGVVYMSDGTPAAGGIILCHKKTVSIPWASSLKELNRWNPNMLLYWTFLEYASNEGFDNFDFGRSTPGEGTYRFKEQWGAHPQSLYWMSIEPGEPDGGRSFRFRESTPGAKNHKRTLAEQIIKKMPIKASQMLGARVRKYISL